jgi:hypothetical protein
VSCPGKPWKAEQEIGPEGRGAAQVSADGDADAASAGHGVAAARAGSLGAETADDGFPERGHALYGSPVGRDELELGQVRSVQKVKPGALKILLERAGL